MKLPEKVRSVIEILRLHVYLPICFLSTMIGLHLAHEKDPFKLITVAMAITLALSAAFSFNDAEDAVDDSFSMDVRNPISLGILTKAVAYRVCFVTATMSLILAWLSNPNTFVAVVIFLILTLIYSWRPIRLKTLPIVDVIVHAVSFSLAFLCSILSTNLAFTFHADTIIITSCFAISGCIAILLHQLYEYKNDLSAGIRTTVIYLGRNVSQFTLTLFVLLDLILLVYASIKKILPWFPLLAFMLSSVAIIVLSAFLSKDNKVWATKRAFPWAINTGAIIAIVTWYSF